MIQCQESLQGSFCEGAFLSLQYLQIFKGVSSYNYEFINELEGWCLGTLGPPLDPPLKLYLRSVVIWKWCLIMLLWYHPILFLCFFGFDIPTCSFIFLNAFLLFLFQFFFLMIVKVVDKLWKYIIS